jgi:hypothetical protein
MRAPAISKRVAGDPRAIRFGNRATILAGSRATAREGLLLYVQLEADDSRNRTAPRPGAGHRGTQV